jgi:phospholipid/cholesterol/gamma-HCH transport system permease protein
MKSIEDIQSCQYEIAETEDGDITIYVQGRMDSSNASRIIEIFGSLIKDRQPLSMAVDLKKVAYIDDFGALVLVELKDMMTRANGLFALQNAREEVLCMLDSETLADTTSFIKTRPPNMFIRFGDAIIQYAADVKYLISFVGSVA